MKNPNYYTTRNINDLDKIAELLKELPPFCEDYFLGIETRTSSQTRLKYAYDLRIFFDFLCKRKYRNFEVQELTLDHLEAVDHRDIEYFLSYLTHYRFRGKQLSCDERAKARKLSAVRALFKYFFNSGLIDVDNSAKVATPKLHSKEIIRLDSEEASYVDLSAELLQPNGQIIKELFSDGLHPNKEGYQRMAKMLKKVIKE